MLSLQISDFQYLKLLFQQIKSIIHFDQLLTGNKYLDKKFLQLYKNVLVAANDLTHVCSVK